MRTPLRRAQVPHAWRHLYRGSLWGLRTPSVSRHRHVHQRSRSHDRTAERQQPLRSMASVHRKNCCQADNRLMRFRTALRACPAASTSRTRRSARSSGPPCPAACPRRGAATGAGARASTGATTSATIVRRGPTSTCSSPWACSAASSRPRATTRARAARSRTAPSCSSSSATSWPCR